MLAGSGHKVYIYGVGYTDLNHPNIEYIPVVSMDDVRATWGDNPLDRHFELGYDHAYHGFRHDITDPVITPCTAKFRANTIIEIMKRKKPNHFLLLSQGCYHRPIANALNMYLTCEPGIGYRGSYAPWRAFESNSIQYFTYGSAAPYGSLDGQYYHRVIPNYFELSDFTFSKTAKSDHIAYIGRLIYRKGITIAASVADILGKRLLIAGQGTLKDLKLDKKSNIEHVGTLGVKDRKRFLSEPILGMTPTIYLEPFGGTAVEFMLSGTPVLTTNFGAFVDTVNHGVSGFRCDTLDDFVKNAKLAMKLDRSKVRKWATQFSMANVNKMYEKWWSDLYRLYLSTTNKHEKGWNYVSSRRKS